MSAARVCGVLFGLASLLSACGPGAPPAYLYFEDFETVCDGSPCGWERSSGEPDQATWVETIHPGEHALRLTGEVGVRGPAGSPEERAILGSGIGGCVVARCDAGSRLQFDVLLEDALVGSVVGTVRLLPPSEWSGPTTADLTLDDDVSDASVTAVLITKTGPGACEVGEIVFEDGTFFFGGACD